MFYPAHARRQLPRNAANDPWIAAEAARIKQAAQPWRDMSLDGLWSLLFSYEIPRSWSVLSNGNCPVCHKPVPMYNWLINPFKHPWKLACPHCGELFPKNDYEAYYQSGLDEQNLFKFDRADASLLFNTEHPDPADPLHRFCVDDGHGVPTGEGDFRWRFVGTYLIYGRWKQHLLGGILALADAFAVGGDLDDARRAAILLHRVADLYPRFDHKTQSLVEEIYRTDGFISTWHDACIETRDMALAYDIIKDAIRDDRALTDFLAEKARKHRLDGRFEKPGDIGAHIERGIFRTAIEQRHKIHCNFPSREVAIMIMHHVMGTNDDHASADVILGQVLEASTGVDGVTGEKGLSAYSAYVLHQLAIYLALLERARPGSIKALINRFPALRQTFRFHIDTWCLQQRYYPTCGDAGEFAGRDTHYAPMSSLYPPRSAGTFRPSLFTLLYDFYKATGDADYLRLMRHANDGKIDGLPYDLSHENPEAVRREVADALAQHGTEVQLGNTLKDQWHLAILRSGRGENERAAWMAFDTGGIHSHAQCMNIGLYAKGLDLMPDMGYPTLQFNNLGTHLTNWYITTAAHNTVVIDGRDQNRPWSIPIGNPSTLWADGKSFAAVRAGCIEAVDASSEPGVGAVLDLPSINLSAIGLYFLRGGRARNLRAFTKPIGAPSGDSGWTLAFEDRFDRAELGPDWAPIEGEWRIENNMLVGHGHLGCARHLPGSQRLEFEAWTDNPNPCDLSATLASTIGGETFRTGGFFGFGSDNNAGSRITSFGKHLVRSEARIVPGKWHAIRCEVDGPIFRLIVDGKEIARYENTPQTVAARSARIRRGKQFERTYARIDLCEKDSYCLDIFRVMGGRDHAKFQHSHFGSITTSGLTLRPSDQPFYDVKLMRNFATDPAPAPGWSVQWACRDEHGYLPPGKQVFLRYIDLTRGASASTCEGWCVKGSYNSVDEKWVPRVMVRRSNDPSGAPLASTFVAIAEPHEGASKIAGVRRLALHAPGGEAYDETNVCVEVTLADGRRDLLAAMDVENPRGLSPAYGPGAVAEQRELGLSFSGELAWVRLSPSGTVEKMALSRGAWLRHGATQLDMPPGATFIER